MTRPRRTARRVARLTVGLLTLAAPGCYLAHAAGGQLRVLLGRESIEAAVATGRFNDAWRAKLRLVLQARRYAAEVLGLDVGGAYADLYDTRGGPIAWNVSASPPDAFAPHLWWFPIVGAVPYLGYFDRAPAEAEAAALRARGLDALLLPVPAYSTLGWFDDPLFTGMLRLDEAALVEVVLHELAHRTIYVPGDADLNETLATFVGRQGALELFVARGGPDDPALAALRDDLADQALFRRAIDDLYERVWRVQAASGDRDAVLARKAEVIAAWRARFEREVRPELTGAGYDFVRDPRVSFDNAFLLMFRRYHGDLDLFEALFEQEGRDLPRTVRLLAELADAPDPRAALEARARGREAGGGAR